MPKRNPSPTSAHLESKPKNGSDRPSPILLGPNLYLTTASLTIEPAASTSLLSSNPQQLSSITNYRRHH